jgi:hypothetical protein
MAAWRRFPAGINYPTWWVSEMRASASEPAVYYRHVRGITRGMDVAWRIRATPGGAGVEIVHEWDGPAWPVISAIAANLVIGPVFIHGIASRTLAGIKRYTETLA